MFYRGRGLLTENPQKVVYILPFAAMYLEAGRNIVRVLLGTIRRNKKLDGFQKNGIAIIVACDPTVIPKPFPVRYFKFCFPFRGFVVIFVFRGHIKLRKVDRPCLEGLHTYRVDKNKWASE